MKELRWQLETEHHSEDEHHVEREYSAERGLRKRNAIQNTTSCGGKSLNVIEPNVTLVVVAGEEQRGQVEPVARIAVSDFAEQYGVRVNLLWLPPHPQERWGRGGVEGEVVVVAMGREEEKIKIKEGEERAQEQMRSHYPFFIVRYPSNPIHMSAAEGYPWSRDNFINLNPFPSYFLAVVLQGGVSRLQPLLPLGSAGEWLATSLSEHDWTSNGVQVQEAVHFNLSTSAHEIWAAVETSIGTSSSSLQEGVGILTCATPEILVELVRSGSSERITWFLIMDKPSTLIFMNKTGIAKAMGEATWPNVTIIQYNTATIYNNDWLHDVNIQLSSEHKITNSIKGRAARIYDSIFVGSSISNILLKSKASLSNAQLIRKIQRASFTWTGITGALDLTRKLKRARSSYTRITCPPHQKDPVDFISFCQETIISSRQSNYDIRFTLSSHLLTQTTLR